MCRENFVALFRWRCAFPDTLAPLSVDWLIWALDEGMQVMPAWVLDETYPYPKDPELYKLLVGYRHRNRAGREAAVRWFLEG